MNNEYNSRSEAYDIVQSFVDTLELKQIDYDKMSWCWKWVTELTRGTFMWVEFRIIFYDVGHPCAYIKVSDTDLMLRDIIKTEWYNGIPCQTCHWWFTFWQFTKEDDTRWFGEWLWIGWDYGHYWDYADYLKDLPSFEEMRKRTTEDILVEVVEQILALKKGGYL